MATSSPTMRKASATVPLISRILLLYFEPIFALGGAIMVLTKPDNYLHTVTRGLVPTLGPQNDFVWTTVAGGWLYFAFTEGVVLRLVDDVRVWRLLCMGMLLSDLAYTHSVAQALGGWDVWLKVWEWTSEDWVVTITTWPFVLARVGIALGLGFRG
ncbi:hypothetical protein LTR86_009066 [Recurvomyces mirabilis]|nr:hypothetical protein LTR86_009066 [Recurvomyces mirabilis]